MFQERPTPLKTLQAVCAKLEKGTLTQILDYETPWGNGVIIYSKADYGKSITYYALSNVSPTTRHTVLEIFTPDEGKSWEVQLETIKSNKNPCFPILTFDSSGNRTHSSGFSFLSNTRPGEINAIIEEARINGVQAFDDVPEHIDIAKTVEQFLEDILTNKHRIPQLVLE